MMTKDIQIALNRATGLSVCASNARRAYDEAAATEYFRAGLWICTKAVKAFDSCCSTTARLALLAKGAEIAASCGEVDQAHELIKRAGEIDPATHLSFEWSRLQNMELWPDEWLIASICGEALSEAGFTSLVKRYRDTLLARCHQLTGNTWAAADLSQDVWARIMRSRHRLKPGGNFPGYLSVIATNLWRDNLRHGRKLGRNGLQNLISLDAVDEDGIGLVEKLPDPKPCHQSEHCVLMIDITHAMTKLPPSLHDALVSRYFIGESCLDIGLSQGCTQQTISSRVRLALHRLRMHLSNTEEAAIEFGKQ